MRAYTLAGARKGACPHAHARAGRLRACARARAAQRIILLGLCPKRKMSGTSGKINEGGCRDVTS